MSIEKIAITDREQWLDLRKSDVTASAIGSLLGVSEYQSAYALYAIKAGLAQDEIDEDQIDEYSIRLSPMARGTLLEDRAEVLLRRLKPKWKVEKCQHYFRDPAARIGATPDLLVVDENGKKGVVQVKNPEASIYRKKWRSEDGIIEPPLGYVAQAITEAHLTGSEFAYVGAFIVGHVTEFRLVPVPIHAGLIDRIYDVVKEFWRRVAENDPYDFDYAMDGKIIAGLFGVDDGSIVDLSSWNAAVAIASEDARLAAEIKERAARRAEIKAQILEKIGPSAVAMINGSIFATCKTVNRKGYEVKPSSYRDLRIKAEFKEVSNADVSISRKPSARSQQSAEPVGGSF